LLQIIEKGTWKGHLANEGFNDWHHLGNKLKENESGAQHYMNMATWYDLRLILQKNETIDKVAQREHEKEKPLEIRFV
jgi:hypothetical protein